MLPTVYEGFPVGSNPTQKKNREGDREATSDQHEIALFLVCVRGMKGYGTWREYLCRGQRENVDIHDELSGNGKGRHSRGAHLMPYQSRGNLRRQRSSPGNQAHPTAERA